MMRQIMSDAKFARWCDSLKECKYCPRKFEGPIVACERRKDDQHAKKGGMPR